MSLVLIGSCRVRIDSFSAYLPCRLHTTAEILCYLKHVFPIYEGKEPHPNLRLVFGDCEHPSVIGDWTSFVTQARQSGKVLPASSAALVEISSSTYMISASFPKLVFNKYYCETLPHSVDVRAYHQTQQELFNDLEDILERINKLGIGHMILLPHLTLPLRSGNPIHARVFLKETLESFALLHDNVDILDLDGAFPRKSIEDVMPDGTHYSDQADMFRKAHIRPQIKRILDKIHSNHISN